MGTSDPRSLWPLISHLASRARTTALGPHRPTPPMNVHVADRTCTTHPAPCAPLRPRAFHLHGETHRPPATKQPSGHVAYRPSVSASIVADEAVAHCAWRVRDSHERDAFGVLEGCARRAASRRAFWRWRAVTGRRRQRACTRSTRDGAGRRDETSDKVTRACIAMSVRAFCAPIVLRVAWLGNPEQPHLPSTVFSRRRPCR